MPEINTGHLLVVDDNKVNRLLLSRSLEQQGHVVEMAENGLQAIEMMQNKPFDLVLLDIEMPEMDGYKVLEKVTSNLQLRDIPIIITSALEELDSVVKCIEMGAEDYLTKPVNPVLLRARITASLEKKHLRDQQRELIKKFATSEVASDLETSGFALGGKFVEATAMFSDIRSFTTIAESQSPAETLLNLDRVAQGKTEIRIGIGIASGQVIAGYTGTTRRATYTCVGDTVNLAARLESHTKVVGKPILIDGNTHDALKAKIRTESEGSYQLKGKTFEVPVYSVPVDQKV